MIRPDPEELATWQASPERSFALLVGLDAYGPGLPATPGLAAQAADIARALIFRGLPPAHIHLLTSGGDVDAPEGVLTGDVTTSSLRSHVQSLIQSEGQFLWGHWSGHGYFEAETHHLLLADASDEMPLNISRADLIERFRRESSPARQYWTIDSCQVHYPDIISPDQLHVGRGSTHGVKQLVLVSSRPGTAAPYSKVGGISPLGEAVITLIGEEHGEEGTRWPPPPGRLEHRLPEIVKRTSRSTTHGQFIVRTPWAEYDHPDFGQRRPAAVRTPLRGWVLPHPWIPAGLNPSCSSLSSTRLDLRWVVDRHPVSIVLADPSDADLADDLNAAEDELDRALAQRVPRRCWTTIEALEPADASGLPATAGTNEPAYVVRVEAGPETVARPGRIREAVDRWVRRIDDRFPACPVIVAVRSHLAVDGVLTVGNLVGAAALERRRNSELPGWKAFTRVRPGAVSVYGPDDIAGSGGPGLSALIARLAAAARSRGLALPSELEDAALLARDLAPPAQRGGQLPGTAEAMTSVVADLEGVVGLDDRVDERLLCSVRDFLPGLFHPLLQEYARKRRGPGWGVSLAVASQFETDLQVWLASARGKGPGERDQWPPTRFGTRPADAVVLHLAREADGQGGLDQQDKLIEAWRRLGTSVPVDAALNVFRSSKATPPTLAELPIGTVSTLARSALYRRLRGENADWNVDATWVALANSAGEGTTLHDELTALASAGDQALVLAALGLVPLPAGVEPLVHERAAELHRILTNQVEGAAT